MWQPPHFSRDSAKALVRLNCDLPGSCPRAFLHFSNFLDTRVLDQDCISKESCHVGVGVDRDNRPRYLIDYLLPVILAAHILDAMWMSVSSPFHQRPWRTVSHQEDCTSKESCHVVFCCIPGVAVTSSSEGVNGETFSRRFQSSVSSPLFI